MGFFDRFKRKKKTEQAQEQKQPEVQAGGICDSFPEGEKPNAVHVACYGVVSAQKVDFTSDKTLGEAFYPAAKELNICYTKGCPSEEKTVCKDFCYFNNAEPCGTVNRMMSDMLGKWIEGGIVVCGYKDGRPAPLCESDVNSVYKYLDSIYRLRKSLGK